MRLQLAINVSDLDEAIDFYSKMFGTAPAKTKPGYANFAIAEPPLKLVLFEVEDAAERLNHLGVEVFDQADVDAARDRISAAGLPTEVQEEATCCYAESSKVWTDEPDGLRWEWYRVIADSDQFHDSGAYETVEADGVTTTGACCGPTGRDAALTPVGATAGESPTSDADTCCA